MWPFNVSSLVFPHLLLFIYYLSFAHLGVFRAAAAAACLALTTVSWGIKAGFGSLTSSWPPKKAGKFELLLEM